MIKLLIGSSVAIVALYLLMPGSKDAEDSVGSTEKSEWTVVADPYAAGRQTVSTVSTPAVTTTATVDIVAALDAATPATSFQHIHSDALGELRDASRIRDALGVVVHNYTHNNRNHPTHQEANDQKAALEKADADVAEALAFLGQSQETTPSATDGSVYFDSTVSRDTVDYFSSVGQNIDFAPESDPVPEQSEMDEYLAELEKERANDPFSSGINGFTFPHP